MDFCFWFNWVKRISPLKSFLWIPLVVRIFYLFYRTMIFMIFLLRPTWIRKLKRNSSSLGKNTWLKNVFQLIFFIQKNIFFLWKTRALKKPIEFAFPHSYNRNLIGVMWVYIQQNAEIKKTNGPITDAAYFLPGARSKKKTPHN